MNKTATLEDLEVDASPAGSVGSSVSEPCTVVLFGASGDLAKRKVIPAMYDLAINNSLGPRYAIVGFARTAMSDESFRGTAGEAAKSIFDVGPIDAKKWSEFASNLYYQGGEYGSAEDFKKLAKRLDDLSAEKKLGGNRLFYLSTPPEVYRIDHYLGKDTVQNLLVLRFSNGIVEPLWNRNYVDHVEITAAETLGVV